MPVGFRSLAGTLRRWRAEIPAWYAACLSNGPAEALNNPFKFVKRVAFGMRRFQHQSGSPDPGVDVVVAGGVVDLPALRPQHVGASRHPALTVELAAPGPGVWRVRNRPSRRPGSSSAATTRLQARPTVRSR
jgi:hypothetical protein